MYLKFVYVRERKRFFSNSAIFKINESYSLNVWYYFYFQRGGGGVNDLEQAIYNTEIIFIDKNNHLFKSTKHDIENLYKIC